MEAEKVSKLGRSLISNLGILVKLTGMYDSMNEAILNAARRVSANIEPFLLEKGELLIIMVGGIFYIDETKIKASMTDVENFTFLTELLDKKSIGELIFKAPINIDDIVYLAYAIKGGEELSEVQSALESKLTKGITLGGPIQVQKEGIDIRDTQAVAKVAYLKAISAMVEIDTSLREGSEPSTRKVKRAVQSIVDCVLHDEKYILGFSTLRDIKEYHYYHPVNVTILSAVVGKMVGFKRLALSRLALSAFLHDVGKVSLPLSVLNKDSEFTSEEMELVKGHPREGVKRLLKVLGLNDGSVLPLRVAYEHHMGLNLSGYPATSPGRKLHLFSRIVGIADDFDSLVSGKVYRRKALTTEEALRLMYANSGTLYDAALLKTFIGIFR